MTSAWAQKYLDESRERLSARLGQAGSKPMTEEERAAFIAGEHQRDLDALAAYQQAHPANTDAAAASIGLRRDELSLDWEAVKPGYSDGILAVAAVKPALERGFGMIFLWGTYGQAKTLVGKILTARAFAAGKKAAYANIVKVLDDIRLAFDERENKTTELLRRMEWWMNRDVLFLDELDKVNSTDWAQERIFQLLDGRYTKAIRMEALTVIASNRSDDELDGYLRSRLQDHRVGPVVHLNGPDARQVMPEGWKF